MELGEDVVGYVWKGLGPWLLSAVIAGSCCFFDLGVVGTKIGGWEAWAGRGSGSVVGCSVKKSRNLFGQFVDSRGSHVASDTG